MVSSGTAWITLLVAHTTHKSIETLMRKSSQSI